MPRPLESCSLRRGRFQAKPDRIGPAVFLLLLVSLSGLAASCGANDPVLADDGRASVEADTKQSDVTTERQRGLAAERRQSKLIAADWGTGAGLGRCPTSTPELGLWQGLGQRTEREMQLVRDRYQLLSPHLEPLISGVDRDAPFAKWIDKMLASEGAEFEGLLDSEELVYSRARLLGCCWDFLLLRRIMRLGIGSQFNVEQVEALALALNRSLAKELIQNPKPQFAQRMQAELIRPVGYLDTLGTCLSPLVEALLQLQPGAVRSQLAQILIDHIEAYRMTGIVPRLDADKVDCVFSTMPGPLREHYMAQGARDRCADILRFERAVAEGASAREARAAEDLPAANGN